MRGISRGAKKRFGRINRAVLSGGLSELKKRRLIKVRRHKGLLKKLVFIIFLFPFFTCLSQEANEILKKSEEKIRGIKSSYQEMSIKIVRPKWSKEMKMKGWSIGEDYFASVVLSPAKEKGIVFLKRENEVWNYIPSIERTVKLPPSMMMQNWMGTDFTNDDLVQRSSIINDYSNTIIKEEEIEGLDLRSHGEKGYHSD